MTAAARVAAAALAVAAAGLLLLDRSAPPPRSTPRAAATVSPPVAPSPRARTPSALAVARRALRWQLAVEAGRVTALPPRTFAEQLAGELATRPPRPAPSSPRARLLRVREQTPAGGLRRVLATVRRGGRAEHVSLLVLCRPGCRIASIE